MIRLYKLIWNNETIEEDIATKEEAIYLRNEYSIAYNGSVRIKQYWGEK